MVHRLLRTFAVLLALVASTATAQVPSSAPGTVCITPTFWCWAQPAGLPGMPCVCLTGTGSVVGYLG